MTWAQWQDAQWPPGECPAGLPIAPPEDPTAYETAVASGFGGTVDDWLEAIRR